jgi:uncharacterized membrane protein
MTQQITRSLIVKASPEEAFRAWANFENFPNFMKYIKTVKKINADTSHWEMEGPAGTTIEWDAEITRFEQNKRIGWSTKDREGDITTSGQVTFNGLPENETEVTVLMQYVPSGGKAGEFVANLFANPEKRLEEDLQNFKNYIEGMHERTPEEHRRP